MTLRLSVARSVASVIAVVATACGARSPTQPGPLPPVVPAPVSLIVSGDTTLATLGASAQLTATVTYTDASRKDVTSDAVWTSRQPSVVLVAAPGVLKAVAPGTAIVVVTYTQWRKEISIGVKPPGYFFLRGVVSEDPGLPLPGATVDIVDGQSAGQSVQSDSDGHFEFFAVSGDLRVRAALDGYSPVVQSVSMSADENLNFELTPAGRPDISGTYQLTIAAADQCRPDYWGVRPLPLDARRRTYGASISQKAVQVHVVLSGAEFVPYPSAPADHTGGSFSGRIIGGSVVFTLDGDPESFYDLLERMTPTTYVGVAGNLTAAIGTQTIDGNLDGLYSTFSGVGSFYGPYGPAAQITGHCDSADHHFIFERVQDTPARARR